MTREEAIKILRSKIRTDSFDESFEEIMMDCALTMAIADMEKQIPKKPIGKYTDYKCSVCGRRVRSGKGSSSRQRDNFCQRCGTAQDWSEEND